MKTELRWKLAMVVLLVTVFFWGAAAWVHAQMRPIQSPLVLLTGTFYSPEEGSVKEKVNTYTVHVEKKEWLFNVKEAKNITGGPTGWELLQNLRPPVLYFRGPQKLIEALEKPEIAGKLIAVKGELYFRIQTLEVTEWKEVTQEEIPEKAK